MNNINVKIVADFDKNSRQSAHKELKEFCEELLYVVEKFKVSFDKQALAYFDDVEMLVSKAAQDFNTSFHDIAGQALRDSLSAPFRGEMDKIEDIWEGAWDNMAERLDRIWQDLLGGLAEKGLAKLENIGYEAFLKPLEDWFEKSIEIPLQNTLKDLINWGKGIFSSGEDSLGHGLGMLNIQGESGGSSGALAKLAGLAGMGGMGGGISLSGGAVAGLGTGASGVLSASLGEGGATAAAGAGLAASTIATAGLLGGLGLVAASPFMLSAMQESMSPDEARARMGSGMEFLQRRTSGQGKGLLRSDTADIARRMEIYGGVLGLSPEELDLVMEGLDGISQRLAELDEQMRQAAETGDSELLASLQQQYEQTQAQAEELARLNQQYGVSVQGLGEENAAVLELAAASEEAALSLKHLGEAYQNSHDHKMDEAHATQQLVGYYQELQRQLEELSGGAVQLGEETDQLVADFLAGQMSAEQFAESMQSKLLEALRRARDEGSLAVERMKDLAQAIRHIPTEWNTTVVTNYVSQGTPPGEHHHGGLIFHHGGGVHGTSLDWYFRSARRLHAGSQVSSLAHDEVPAILQRGEFVVRKESVTAATLPLLQGLNQAGGTAGATGAVLPAGTGVVVQGPLVEIQGHYLGDEESREELVRQIEAKLYELHQLRYHA